MKKFCILVALCVFCIPLAASADNIGSCGWGSKLMDGQKGIFPQVLAATTNGTSGNQTFAITSGTSGCTQDGVVSSSWQTAMFIDANKTKLARDISIGEGETLDSLASLLKLDESKKDIFIEVAKADFDQIFPTAAVTTEHVISALRVTMAKDARLTAHTASL